MYFEDYMKKTIIDITCLFCQNKNCLTCNKNKRPPFGGAGVAILAGMNKNRPIATIVP